MSTLLDRILDTRQFLVYNGVLHPNEISQLQESTAIDANNIFTYYDTSKKDEWNSLFDFPNLAPAFETSWFEWEQPMLFTNMPSSDRKIGVLQRTLESPVYESLSKEDKLTFPKWVIHSTIFFYMQPAPFGFGGFSRAADTMYGVRSDGQLFYDKKVVFNRDATESFESIFMSLCNGKSVGVPVKLSDEMQEYLDKYGADYEETVSHMQYYLHVPCLTTTFLHCKNIRRIPSPTTPTAKEQKRRAQKNKLPRVIEYTLVIQPMKELLQASNSGLNNSLSPKALHICRGHFRNYDNKPLFGKYKGSFFVPQHARGNAKNGEIIKDYKLDLS